MERNSQLHEVRHSVHPQEEAQLHDEIKFEHDKGIDLLSADYHPVFNTPLHIILKRSLQHKVSWLFSVWVARESAYPAYLSLPSIDNPNSTLRFKFIQWKEKIL